jgi:hypothetical protein
MIASLFVRVSGGDRELTKVPTLAKKCLFHPLL